MSAPTAIAFFIHLEGHSLLKVSRLLESLDNAAGLTKWDGQWHLGRMPLSQAPEVLTAISTLGLDLTGPAPVACETPFGRVTEKMAWFRYCPETMTLKLFESHFENQVKSMQKEIKSLFEGKKAVLWDFDGCFCDSETQHYHSYREVFEKFGHSPLEEVYYERFPHLGLGAAFEIQEAGLNVTPETIRDMKKEVYASYIEKKRVKIFPETRGILTELRRLGIRSVIASNSPNEEIESILDTADLGELRPKVYGWQKGLRKKPFPDMFLHAMSNEGLAPTQCLVFEDSERGLQAASAAGCQAIWIRSPQNAPLETQAPHVKSLTHQTLLDLLRGVV